jgi:hypothetical protein
MLLSFFHEQAQPSKTHSSHSRSRAFTRLTNAFSKKIDNLGYAVALHFMHYNFCWIHQTLRVTPAMEAGIADHVWSIEEIVELLTCSREAAA